jgi:hypothetical protein
MGKCLDAAACAQYAREGYYFPVDVLSASEAATCRALLERFESTQGHALYGAQRSKSHLLFTWIDELIRHPRVLDAVEDLIGPDILCWNTLWWIKEPASESYVGWHQDLRYWGLDSNELVTVWLALSPATVESGCMRILPRSHIGDMLPHDDLYNADNLLTRGQEISVTVDEATTVAMELAPGQISMHNVRVAHASAPNRARDRRIGISMHYIPPSARQLAADWDTASLVRGQDRHHHFTLAPRPKHDFDPEVMQFHADATNAFRAILFKDAERVRPTL